MLTKICTKCKREKTLDHFSKGNDKNELNFRCRDCNGIYSLKYYYNNRQKQLIQKQKYKKVNKDKIKEQNKIYSKKYILTPSSIYFHIKNNAIKKNLISPFNKEEFIVWYNSQEQKCYYCERTLKEIKQDNQEKNKHKNRLSIDRKNNSKGYELDNIVLACYRCNATKSDYFTEKQMLRIAPLLYRC